MTNSLKPETTETSRLQQRLSLLIATAAAAAAAVSVVNTAACTPMSVDHDQALM